MSSDCAAEYHLLDTGWPYWHSLLVADSISACGPRPWQCSTWLKIVNMVSSWGYRKRPLSGFLRFDILITNPYHFCIKHRLFMLITNYMTFHPDDRDDHWGCLSHRIVGSVRSGRCWFVYQIYPSIIDTLLTGMGMTAMHLERTWQKHLISIMIMHNFDWHLFSSCFYDVYLTPNWQKVNNFNFYIQLLPW